MKKPRLIGVVIFACMLSTACFLGIPNLTSAGPTEGALNLERVGIGMAKGRDVQQSILKAYNQAKKHLVTIVTKDGTIPHQVEGKYSSAVVILKPSKSGIKAGGAVRVVAQMAGITSLTGKLTRRTNNKLNIARATMAALAKLHLRAEIK